MMVKAIQRLNDKAQGIEKECMADIFEDAANIPDVKAAR